MEAYAGEWLQLLIRWVHLITGIAWIGASFYFKWLDNSQLPPKRGAAREGWPAICGRCTAAASITCRSSAWHPPTAGPLHWFKWEAYSTWLTGLALFIVLLLERALFLLKPGVPTFLRRWRSARRSRCWLAAGWSLRRLCNSPGSTAICSGGGDRGLLDAGRVGLSQVFSGRAVYIQVGAMIGSVMAANVAHVIIPSQRALVTARRRASRQTRCTACAAVSAACTTITSRCRCCSS